MPKADLVECNERSRRYLELLAVDRRRPKQLLARIWWCTIRVRVGVSPRFPLI
jgi:hypothetical protein